MLSSPGETEVAQTPDLRASYPRSSDNLTDQEVPDASLAEFASNGTGLAVVDIEDLPDAFATETASNSNGRPTTPGSSVGAGSSPRPARRRT